MERVDFETTKQLREYGFPWSISQQNPTALQIIEQMPPGTRILFDLSVWEVWFPVAQMQEDFRYDTCPHKAAALAFIAWKKGLET